MIVCIMCFVFNVGYRQSKSHVSINLLTYLHKVSYPEEYSTPNDISYQALGQ